MRILAGSVTSLVLMMKVRRVYVRDSVFYISHTIFKICSDRAVVYWLNLLSSFITDSWSGALVKSEFVLLVSCQVKVGLLCASVLLVLDFKWMPSWITGFLFYHADTQTYRYRHCNIPAYWQSAWITTKMQSWAPLLIRQILHEKFQKCKTVPGSFPTVDVSWCW